MTTADEGILTLPLKTASKSGEQVVVARQHPDRREDEQYGSPDAP
jgi:hypothetical protein